MIRPLLFVLLCVLHVSPPGNAICGNDSLTVVYTGNSRGKLRACGCPGDPYGGLAERAGLIRSLREQKGPFLLVDSGNMVSLFGDYSRKAGYVIRLMNLMGYDAAGIGFNELYRGLEPVERMAEAASFPLLSASVAADSSSQPITTPSAVVTVGDAVIGITAVSDPASHRAVGKPIVSDYHILTPGGQFDQQLSALERQCDYIIVLSQLTSETNREFLAAHPTIDLIIQGWGNETLDPPLETPDGIIAAPGGRGQFVGIMELKKYSGENVTVISHEFRPVLDIPEDKEAQDIVRDYYLSIK